MGRVRLPAVRRYGADSHLLPSSHVPSDEESFSACRWMWAAHWQEVFGEAEASVKGDSASTQDKWEDVYMDDQPVWIPALAMALRSNIWPRCKGGMHKRALPVPVQRHVPADFWQDDGTGAGETANNGAEHEDGGCEATVPFEKDDATGDNQSQYGTDPPTDTELDSPEDNTEEPLAKKHKSYDGQDIKQENAEQEDKEGSGMKQEPEANTQITVELMSDKNKWLAHIKVEPHDMVGNLANIQKITTIAEANWNGTPLNLDATWIEQCDLQHGYLIVEIIPKQCEKKPDDDKNDKEGDQELPKSGVRVILRSWPKGRKTYKAYLDPTATVLELYAEFAALSKRGINTFRLYQGSQKLPDDMPILDLNPDFLVSVIAYPSRTRPHPEWQEIPPTSEEEGLQRGDRPRWTSEREHELQDFCKFFSSQHSITKQWIPKYQQKQAFQVIPNQGDGDCFWRAVGYLLKEKPETTKQKIMYHASNTLHTRLAPYLKWISQERAWADTACILLLMEACKTDVTIHTPSGMWAFTIARSHDHLHFWLSDDHYEAIAYDKPDMKWPPLHGRGALWPVCHGGGKKATKQREESESDEQSALAVKKVKTNVPKLMQPVHLKLLMKVDEDLSEQIMQQDTAEGITKLVKSAAKRYRLPINDGVAEVSQAREPSKGAEKSTSATKKTPSSQSARDRARTPGAQSQERAQDGAKGWVRVAKEPPKAKYLSLRSEDWSVPATHTLLPQHCGVVLCQDEAHCKRVLKGISLPAKCAQALLTKERYTSLELEDPEKIAFTATLQTADGDDNPEAVTRIGWLYQLNPESKVLMTRQQQRIRMTTAPSTKVVRAMFVKAFTDSDVWEAVDKRADLATFKKAICELLPSSAPRSAVMDTWGMRKQQDTVTCSVRVQSNVMSHLLKRSGTTAVFVSPMGEERNEFEVIWQQAALRQDIAKARSQLTKLTMHAGLVGSPTGVGFRVAPEYLSAARDIDPKQSKISVSGVPLPLAENDVRGLLASLNIDVPEEEDNAQRVVRGHYATWFFKLPNPLPEEHENCTFQIEADNHAFIEEDCVVTIATCTASATRSRSRTQMRWAAPASMRSRSSTTLWRISPEVNDENYESSDDEPVSEKASQHEDDEAMGGDDETQDAEKEQAQPLTSSMKSTTRYAKPDVTQWELRHQEDDRDAQGQLSAKRSRSRPPRQSPAMSSTSTCRERSTSKDVTRSEIDELKNMTRMQQATLLQLQQQLQQINELMQKTAKNDEQL